MKVLFFFKFVRSFPKIVLILSWTLLTAIVFSVIGEFFVEYFKLKGYYNNPVQALDYISALLSGFFLRPTVLFISGVVIGLSITLAIDRVNKANRPRITSANHSDIADRAQILAGKIFALSGSLVKRRSKAWEREVGNGMFATADAESSVVDEFMTLHLVEFWEIMSISAKLISFDEAELWQLSHGISSASDVHTYGRLLVKISVDLMYDMPTLPTYDRRRQHLEQQTSAQPAAPATITV